MQKTGSLLIKLFILFACTACVSETYEPTYAVCGNVKDFHKISAAGYDYIESNVGYLIPDKSDTEFQTRLDEIKKAKAKIISCTNFIPGSLKIVGHETKHEAALVWAEMALRRAQMINIPYIVFGSGGARKVPDGFDRQKATQQFVDFCKKLAPLAKKYKVTIVVEPLNTSETNMINSLKDGAEIVEAVGHPNIRLLCDIYHMMRENEPASEIVKYGNYIKHCHIAEKEGRKSPGVNGEDFKPYFRALKQIKYKGCLSIECSWGDFDKELQPALLYMEQQFYSL
jgi:sugar phosphate isomerase/epimerase